MLSLICYILVCPTTVTTMLNGEAQNIANVLSTDVTASKGLFVAMIVSMVAITLFNKMCHVEKLKINLPEAVPPNVAKSFSDLLPTIITTIVIAAFAFVFERLMGTNISLFIFQALQNPITVIFQHPLGIVFSAFFAALFWLCGLHGASIVTGIINPITIVALQENMEAVAAGAEPANIVVKPFWNLYATMGGFGCTLALLIAILLVSKRDDDRAIAKLSLVPGLFGINEPVIFGIPIVMNPIMAIPFVLSPVVCCIIGYGDTAMGLCSKIISDVPWCLPPVVNGFIATGGDIWTAIVQMVCIALTVVIWIPFVKIRNKEIE